MPEPKVVTGDKEIDAVLWLQECVRTGHPALIETAMEAAKRITTPMKTIGDRYAQYLMRQTKGNGFFAALGSMGFGELESQAKGAIKRQEERHAALSRFGTKEALLADTPAESACEKALLGLRRKKTLLYRYDEGQALKRFIKTPDLVALTLADCLHAQNYWDQLYSLRCPFDECGDPQPEGSAHDDYCFGQMAAIKPRSEQEAVAVLTYLEEKEHMDRNETFSILRNLISGGWHEA